MDQLDLRTINVELDFDEPILIKVQYDVSSAREYYPEIVDWVREAPLLNLGERAINALMDVIVAWDFQNDDGSLFTPTTENMMQTPIFVLSRIISEIGDDMAA